MPPDIHYSARPEANALLESDPMALVIGLVIYQQVPAEKAVEGPYVLKERLGGSISAADLAGMPPEDLEAAFRERPALHRFPAAMAKRVQAVASYVVEELDGDPSNLWEHAGDATELSTRIQKMPGFGEYKARIYMAVLARQFDVKPEGWEKHVPDWPNISEVRSDEDRAEMRARKKEWKEATKAG